MHYFLVFLYFHGNGDSKNNIQEINWFWICLNSNQPFAGIRWDLSVLIPSVQKSNWPSQRHTHLPISYLARCDNIRFHWTPEWKEPKLPKSAGLILHSSIWKSVFKLGKKPRLSLSFASIHEKRSVFSIWKCSFSLPTFQTFYDTLPAILMWTVRLCLLSAEAEGVRNGCVRQGSGGRILWPANHKTTALVSLWLSRRGCIYRRKWVWQGVFVCVCVWMRSPLGRTASTFQMLMLILTQLNIKCVGARRGVITERATQETRGRLAQWSGVAVVIVISGHHITPWYSQ